MERKYCPHLIVICQSMLVYHLRGTYNSRYIYYKSFIQTCFGDEFQASISKDL